MYGEWTKERNERVNESHIAVLIKKKLSGTCEYMWIITLVHDVSYILIVTLK